MSAGVRASERLVRDKDSLAGEITGALYAALPELAERYGEAGRRRCLEDMGYNIDHLAPAVHLGMPGMFASYVRWLDEVLSARSVDSAEVVASLELTESLVRERFPADEAAEVTRSIHAGIAVLDAERGE